MSLPATIEQNKTKEKSRLIFSSLPAYAKFIRESHLIEYIKHQIHLCRELGLPLLRYFEHLSDEQLLEISIPNHTKFLLAAEENKLEELLEESLEKWRDNDIGTIDKTNIATEDLITGNYIRKQSLLKFLPLYTTDAFEVLNIVKEIDSFIVFGEKASVDTYVNILKEKLDQSSKLILQREEQLLEAQEIGETGSFDYDLMQGKTQVTPQLLKILEMDSITSLTEFLQYVFPPDRIKVQNAIDKAIKETGIYECEYRYEKNGKEKVIWSKGKVIYNSEGTATKMRGTIMDMTERHQLIKKLQESEGLYKQAQAISNVGNSEWNIETKELVWSDEIYRIYGIEPQTENISTYFGKMTHPDDQESLNRNILQAIQTSGPYDFYYRIVLEDGTIKTLHAKGKVVTNKDGKPIKTVGTIQDVTKQKLTEKRLEDYQEFIQKITDVTPSIIASYNIHSGRYTFVNKAIENILGYSVRDILDNGLEFMIKIIHPDDVGPLMEKNAKALDDANANVPADGNEKVVEFKYRMRHVNGNYIWLRTLGTIFERNAKNEVESILNVSIDITEQEEAEKELSQKNLELQQSNSSLEEYAYVASHDLKEPLRKISTFSDRLLHSEKNLTDDGVLYLNKIIDASKKMQTLINDLLAVSVISGKKEFEEISLQTILDEILNSLEIKIEEKKAVIISDNLPVARVIKTQFRQLFQNLIDNSLKFTRANEIPRIEISHRYLNYSDVKELNPIKAKKYLEITVSDNGIGFENIFANKIFTIFQRLHSRNDYEGNGIGLTICRKIVEGHGGVIIASSAPNNGARFTIIIPS